MKKVRISQKQIARDLGLSQTLVSMVLNGRRKGVSESSYQQIWDHARRVGYRPKGMDTEFLGEPVVTTVGVILRSGINLGSQSPFFGHLQDGLHEYLVAHGHTVVFLGSEEKLDVEKLRQSYGSRRAFHGLVIFGEVKRAFVHALKVLEPRIVSVSAKYPGLCHSVIYNEEQSAELLVQHLTDLGHHQFAWLGGNRGTQRGEQRYDAAISALHLRKITIPPPFRAFADGGDRIDGRQAAEKIFSAMTKRAHPTAWICFNGLMARGAANYLLQMGVRIPEDISIATFDRTRICVEEHPTLTGASADPEELGRVAGELILKSSGTANETLSDCVLPSSLITRESTGPCPDA